MSNVTVEAVIVDLDGTMVDTVGDFEVALRLALADLGWPPVGRDFIVRTVGKGEGRNLQTQAPRFAETPRHQVCGSVAGAPVRRRRPRSAV